MQSVMATFQSLKMARTGREASWLYDDEGRRYLHFHGGIGTNSLGLVHPALLREIREQAGMFVH